MTIEVLGDDDKARLARIGIMGPDAPITLKEACEKVFVGAIKVSTLMAEHRRGNLVISKIGRQYFTTLRHIDEMRGNCTVEHPGRFVRPVKESNGWPQAVQAEAAQAALRLTLQRLRDEDKAKKKSSRAALD